MARLNKRNAANIQNNPQMQTMQTMQKVTPLIFGVIYIAFPIGVTVYFIVSSFCRIVIQEILFRTGVTAPKPAGQGGDRALPAPRRRGLMDRLADAQATAQEQRRRQAEMNGTINAISRDATPRDAISRDATPRRGAEEDADADEPGSAGSAKPTPPSNQGRPRKAQSLQPGTRTPAEKSDNGTNGTSSTQRGQSATKGNGRPPRASGGNGSTANGRTGPRTHSEDEDEAAKPKQVPPRSKDKRPRKAR
jgi:hypothetical protein